MGGQSVEDLERVIAAMRRVVERLQGENDQLKKTVGAGGLQYGEVIKENKRLKVRTLNVTTLDACRVSGNRFRSGNHPIFIYSLSSHLLNGYITNSHNDHLPVGLIAHLVEHCTGIVEVMGSNPVQA